MLFSTKNFKLLTSRSSPPTPFFDLNSLSVLEDFYKGNGADKDVLVSKGEIVVVMLYAPWSLSSIEAQKPFYMVASAFQDFNSTVFLVFKTIFKYRNKLD